MIQKRTVVVDGSNLATEGRSLPSLVQLDECVRAFAEEMPNAEIVVVVDATFEHRIDDRERRRFKEAELAGEVVTPPAGAIGRGDAFILKIAARTNAVILSNDSFQEFHGEYPWLFDDGRLIGGKPISGIGWVFTPRNPVRGPKSRASRARHAEPDATTSDAAPSKSRRASQKAQATATAAPVKKAARSTAAKATVKRAAAAPEKAAATSKRGRSTKSAALSPPDAPAVSARAPRSAKKAAERQKPGTAPTGRGARASSATPTKRREVPAVSTASSVKGSRRLPKAAEPVVSAAKVRPAAIDAASRASKRSGTGPVNTPRAFNALIKEHPLRSKVEGEVVAFTSHGATISIAVGRGMEAVCYAPLARLGRPAPTRARDVLKKGERRSFKVVAFDNERRIAEVSLT